MDKLYSTCRMEVLSGVPFFFAHLSRVDPELTSLSRSKLCECELVGLVTTFGDSGESYPILGGIQAWMEYHARVIWGKWRGKCNHF